jgi:hypothetical protein
MHRSGVWSIESHAYKNYGDAPNLNYKLTKLPVYLLTLQNLVQFAVNYTIQVSWVQEVLEFNLLNIIFNKTDPVALLWILVQSTHVKALTIINYCGLMVSVQ